MPDTPDAGAVSHESHLDLAEGIRSVTSGNLEAKLNQGSDPSGEHAAQGALSGNVAFRNAPLGGLDASVIGLAPAGVDLANIALIAGGANGSGGIGQALTATLLAGATIDLGGALQ